MHIKLFSEVLSKATELQGSRLVVMLVLVFYANERGECWPKLTTIASKAHLSLRHTARIIQELTEVGYIAYGPPQKRGYPATIRLCVVDVKHSDIHDMRHDSHDTKADEDVILDRTSVGVTQAPINIELKENRVKLTTLSQLKKQGPIYCHRAGCREVVRLRGTYCPAHYGELTGKR
ncbi:MAG: helix-turn-helix domain-containing protein [Chloroflexota bacterium]